MWIVLKSSGNQEPRHLFSAEHVEGSMDLTVSRVRLGTTMNHSFLVLVPEAVSV